MTHHLWPDLAGQSLYSIQSGILTTLGNLVWETAHQVRQRLGQVLKSDSAVISQADVSHHSNAVGLKAGADSLQGGEGAGVGEVLAISNLQPSNPQQQDWIVSLVPGLKTWSIIREPQAGWYLVVVLGVGLQPRKSDMVDDACMPADSSGSEAVTVQLAMILCKAPKIHPSPCATDIVGRAGGELASSLGIEHTAGVIVIATWLAWQVVVLGVNKGESARCYIQCVCHTVWLSRLFSFAVKATGGRSKALLTQLQWTALNHS